MQITKKVKNIVAGILGILAGLLFLLVTALLLVMVFGNALPPEYRDTVSGPHPLGVVGAILQVAVNLLFFVAGGCSFAGKGKLPALIGSTVCLCCGLLISLVMSSILTGVFHYISTLCFAVIAWLQWAPRKKPLQQGQ